MDIYFVNILTGIITLLFGYIFGAIPNGVIIGKLFFHKDPRDFGSGNSGGTNTGRVLGKGVGLLVIVLDMVKAALPVYISWAVLMFTPLHAYYVFGSTDWTPLYYWLSGLGAAIGHCWPVYLKFKGGKAVACFMGISCLTSWLSFLIGIFYLVPLKTKKMVSVASILGGLFQVLGAWGIYFIQIFTDFDIRNFMWTFYLGDGAMVQGLWYAVVMTIIYVILVIRHRTNIERIREGTENKISWLK